MIESSKALDIELLRTFHSAVHLGSLAAAAEARHRTLSAISMQLKRLESQLGTRLLVRGSRGVVPTPRGEALLHETRALLRLHDQVLGRFTGQKLTGKVRLGLPEDYAHELLLDVLPEFITQHPQVVLEVVTATSGELATQIRRAQLALAIILDRPISLPGGDALWQTDPIWAAPKHTSFDDRPSWPLALHGDHCPYRQLAIEALEGAGMSWHAVFTSTSIHAIESAIEAGLAISVIDRERMTPMMRELGSAEGLPSLRPCQAQLHLAPQIDDESSEAVEALAQLLRQRLHQRGPWRANRA
ncbi:LysR family transcriptional regulator [Terasakiispira papahanaumokuakeensis]|uniref:LysR family transcriptional regulator n=1 Tax=Terasakiispira papahanaumokuakeensis TaxID=197479 RepID=A0A1E2VBL8_9GAMM|nr:LysR substrate-binding domain-containing protein [Terasakiispira papahanaumokuakeensis]ODC04398.1 LysR family transcriptional regulator [Terasakiispira papahanaumokuakeensis]